jgi:serine/threonine protein kinase
MSEGSAYGKIHSPILNVNSGKKRKKLTFLEKLNLLLDAAKGMVYLHTFDPPIIHRDLKSQNLLVCLFFLIFEYFSFLRKF